MRIYSQSKYDQNDGFNWRWEVQPDYAITILSRTKDYCDIQAGQDLGTADLYFKYDFYDGASKLRFLLLLWNIYLFRSLQQRILQVK